MKFLFSFILIMMFVGIVSPVYGQEGLVPCGRTDVDPGAPESSPCTLCHIYVLAENIVDFLMWQAVPIIAVLAFAWAGFKILISGDSPGSRQEGYKIMKTTLVGLLIVFSAWIVMNEFLFFLAKGRGSSASSTTPVVTTVLSNPWNKIDCK